MKLVNLTPHAVNLAGGLVVPPSGTVARCREVSQPRGALTIEGGIVPVPLVSKRFQDLEGLPEPVEGVLYIASALAARAAWEQGRRDVVCPGDPIRDDEGRVVGAAALCVCPEE